MTLVDARGAAAEGLALASSTPAQASNLFLPDDLESALVVSAFAQSARDIRGASPYIAVENEPPPKLIVDPPRADALAQGVFWAQYRVENIGIVQAFGAGARQVSPRIGHLHIIVDDLPWWWADASDNNTVDIAGLPPGPHKVTISLVDADHNVFPDQVKTLSFIVPEHAGTRNHAHAN
ncbi:DUF6130 family protein [Bradyrhizobium sp. PMVTL-01]|uniref:DUF6130 family protein n=1 Tax=unclassified Bradyrhizobium TaxID=2631580 RepID=UPI003F6F51FC